MGHGEERGAGCLLGRCWEGKEHAGLFVCLELEGSGLRNSCVRLNASIFPVGLYLWTDILIEQHSGCRANSPFVSRERPGLKPESAL